MSALAASGQSLPGALGKSRLTVSMPEQAGKPDVGTFFVSHLLSGTL